MKIALLGWGSLIWDEHLEFDKQHTVWSSDGPKLKLEFSRISGGKRKGALTLVIDDKNGAACTVQYALSKRKKPDDAICDLRSREGTVLRCIGYYFLDGSRTREPETPENIKTWALGNGIDVVVWTGLQGNFYDKLEIKFSVKEALSYLRSLPPEGKVMAAEYIRRAKDYIDTPLRRALKTEPWFAEHHPSS